MGKDLRGRNIGTGYSQRKDGRYEARATINGVKIDMYNKNLAELRKDFEKEKAKVLCSEKNIRRNLTLLDWYEEWFETCKAPQLKSEASRKTYNRKAKNTFCALLGNKKIENISQMNMQKAANDLITSGYTPRTVREALGVMKECFDIGIVNHVVTINPCIGVSIKNDYVPKERRVLTHEEQDRFLEEAKHSYYYEAYQILLLTGMRIGEFSGLQWDDVDFVNKQININRSMSTTYIDGKKIEELTTPKTQHAYRSIPFFGETEGVLLAWKKKQDVYKKQLGDRWRAKPEFGDLVFTSTVGSPVTRYVIVHDIRRIMDNINMKEYRQACIEGRDPVELKGIHPHAFRHTFATRCFEKGLDPLFVQNVMGHSNYSTTVSYTHVLDNIKQREAAKAGDFLK